MYLICLNDLAHVMNQFSTVHQKLQLIQSKAEDLGWMWRRRDLGLHHASPLHWFHILSFSDALMGIQCTMVRLGFYTKVRCRCANIAHSQSQSWVVLLAHDIKHFPEMSHAFYCRRFFTNETGIQHRLLFSSDNDAVSQQWNRVHFDCPWAHLFATDPLVSK